MKKQRLAVLGSTGSIGASTLDVAARHPDRIEVVALTAATQVDKLLAQCERFRPRVAAMASAPHAAQLAEKIRQKGLEVRVDTALILFPKSSLFEYIPQITGLSLIIVL